MVYLVFGFHVQDPFSGSNGPRTLFRKESHFIPIERVGENVGATSEEKMAGIVLTGGLRPSESVLRVIRAMPIPVLLTQEDSYQVASMVHDLNVKTRPDDAEKISLIRDIVARNVNVKTIVEAL